MLSDDNAPIGTGDVVDPISFLFDDILWEEAQSHKMRRRLAQRKVLNICWCPCVIG